MALAFILGGVIILWVERRQRQGAAQDMGQDTVDLQSGSPLPRQPRIQSVDEMRWPDALKVGLAQSLALIPGTSRSGATIIGGLCFGLSRRAATEFSFFLAVPTLMAAGAWDMWKNRALFSLADLPLFAVGTVVSFLSAFVCVRWLLRYIANHDFTLFAWYRIAFGGLVLFTAWSGMVRWSVG